MSLLQHPAFLRFWLARFVGTGAQQMLMLAIGWQMYGLTGSAWDLGLVGLAQFAPSLAAALPAGHAADRFHRARLVLACYAVQGGVALLLLAATTGGWASRGVLLGLSVLLGGLRPFQMAAQQALLPALVPLEMLARAMALGSAGVQAAVIGGPALAGLLFTGGVGVVYGSCFALFAAGCVVLTTVRYEHAPPPREPPTIASLLAGVKFIGNSRVLLGAVSLDLFAVLLGGATALLPIFAAEILHVGATGLGLLRSAPAVGALLMAAALARWPLTRRVGHRLLVAVAVFGACMVVFGLSTSFALSLVALAVSGAADMVSVIVRQTLVQLETPDAMRGRVAAVNTLFIGASNQLGEFESGATAALLGPVGSVVAGGVGTLLVAAAWLRLFPALARRDRFSPQDLG
ncbi:MULTISPECIES: MFS transporter [Ramlibacter]|uniref:MFS transporter n=1 Tax=Ramlibacter pinisoli TaxID=2682844 RepID=A0A6N8J0S0_9BURK|nr:MFS transporter [Ramlibacter sp. CGMCC 1.13660]MVQ32628.1 MFS transporter [Ramlibacter pinisoli]